MEQTPLIHGLDWDTLIILDACRYDYFRDEVDNYMKGKLIQVRSPSNDSLNWLKMTWPGRYDLTYFSANPFINGVCEVQGFDAKKHFKEIVDVWAFGWNYALSTIPPWNVNQAVKETPPRGRAVIHYMQPHGPWIGETKLTIEGLFYTAGEGAVFFPDGQILNTVRVEPSFLRRAYRDNLRLVLEHVKQLLPSLRGRVAITSDHGELLGKYGLFLHVGEAHAKLDVDELRAVPWFKVQV